LISVVRPVPQDQAIADRDVVLGVDTHAETHTAAVVTSSGVLLDVRSFSTTTVGYEQMLAWARGYGDLGRAGVECTGSYGKALTRHLNAAGIEVVEVSSSDKATRRRRGKTDALDAEAAALSVLNGRAAAIPRLATVRWR
jgi:transposase